MISWDYGKFILSLDVTDGKYVYTLRCPGLRLPLKGVGVIPVSAFVRLSAAVLEYAPDVERAKRVLFAHTRSRDDESLRTPALNRGVRLGADMYLDEDTVDGEASEEEVE